MASILLQINCSCRTIWFNSLIVKSRSNPRYSFNLFSNQIHLKAFTSVTCVILQMKYLITVDIFDFTLKVWRITSWDNVNCFKFRNSKEFISLNVWIWLLIYEFLRWTYTSAFLLLNSNLTQPPCYHIRTISALELWGRPECHLLILLFKWQTQIRWKLDEIRWNSHPQKRTYSLSTLLCCKYVWHSGEVAALQ